MQPGEGTYTHYYVRKQEADEGLKADINKARSFAWSARVRWTEGMQARAFIRNHSFNVGQPASFDTQDMAPSAVEYVLAAMGGCLAVGFRLRASRRGIEVRNLEAIKADEARLGNEIQQLTPAHEGAPEDVNARNERHRLEGKQDELHREERTEERAYWTDVQPLVREDREIHKTTLQQDERRKRIDELM